MKGACTAPASPAGRPAPGGDPGARDGDAPPIGIPGPGPCRAAWGAEVPAQGRQQRGGFTLIEVLIAAAILGVGLTALLTAASRCLAVMRAAQQYQDAQWALNLGELEHPVLPTQDYKDWEVSAEAYDHGMTYSREVEEPDEERKDGLYLLRSRVTWSSKNRRGYEEVVRYVFVKEKAEL